MLGARAALAMITASAAAIAAPAEAEARRATISIPAGPLSVSLRELGRQAGVSLMFQPETVRGLSAPAVRGTLSVEGALHRLLAGHGLIARRSASGAYLIEQRRASRTLSGQPPPSSAPEEPLVPEILVVGRRNHNADIRRRENDVQPYQVSSGREIVQAHRDDLDQYFRSRVTANTQAIPPSLSDEGETLSEIDLRGLGSDDTLILVDGRRLPSVPNWQVFPLEDPVGFGFRQPDLNAIPLHAIERVETLTGTAGGIHGFGALGGVVNVVLQRNYRGAELHGTFGISSRGDSERLSLEGRVGFTPNDGRTDAMLYLSHSRSKPLLVGERNYKVRELQQRFRRDPDSFTGLFGRANSVYVEPLVGSLLSFKPEFGGATLDGGFTYLPVGFTGGRGELVQTLAERAGRRDFSLSEGQAATGLGSTPTLTTGILNVRHRFSGRLEGYFDALVMRNRGRHEDRSGWALMLAFDDSPINPFDQSILLHFPLPGTSDRRRQHFTTSRYTAGLVADLPLEGWRGTAEVTFGSIRAELLRERTGSKDVFLAPPFGPDINPLGNWEELRREVVIDPFTATARARARNHYGEQSLRLAGPLLVAPGGPVTLTLLAERRNERVPSFTTIETFESLGDNIKSEKPTGKRASATTSFYGELRAPLFGESAPVPPLKELELQLAVRHDRLRANFDPNPLDLQTDQITSRRFSGTSLTVGAKASPLSWLMLRGSYATGAQPPALELLVPREKPDEFSFAQDPKRGNGALGFEGLVLLKTGGSPDLQTARATTLSLGMVLNPAGRGGPRISLDFSRIRKTRDPTLLFAQLVLANEDFWPERVSRAPLTQSDRALGYTAGRVTAIDERAANVGGAKVDSLDARFDWVMPLRVGKLRLYGAATLQMSNEQRRRFERPVERVGFVQGPLKWRANAGADWSIGATAFGANLQFFSRYRIEDAVFAPITDYDLTQGSKWVRSQAYLDLYASRSFVPRNAGPLRGFDVNIGIVNLLDTPPPRETSVLSLGPGYSRYGDPRRRRFELVLSSKF